MCCSVKAVKALLWQHAEALQQLHCEIFAYRYCHIATTTATQYSTITVQARYRTDVWLAMLLLSLQQCAAWPTASFNFTSVLLDWLIMFWVLWTLSMPVCSFSKALCKTSLKHFFYSQEQLFPGLLDPEDEWIRSERMLLPFISKTQE